MRSIYLFILYVCLAFAVVLVTPVKIHAQDAASAFAAVQAQAANPADPSLQLSPAPVAAVVVPEPAAPPEWATEVLVGVAKLPVIGPYISKALLYFGILAALLTTLVGAALSILATLKTGFSWAGLDTAVAAIEKFRAGKIVYWLTYFSNFNAKKPVA